MPRKKAHRRVWGSITEVVKGKKYILRWPQNTPQGRKRKTETFYGTYRQADERLNQIRYEKAQPPTMTVGDLWERHELPRIEEDVAEGRRSAATASFYRSTWKNHVAPRWKDVPCTEVRPMDVQAWLLTKSKATGEACRLVLKLCMDFAEMLELVVSNPAAKKFRYGNDTAREKSIYTEDELARLEASTRNSVAEVPFMLCTRCGLRVGEACGMPVSCISFEDGYAVLEVTEQLSRVTGAGSKLKTKNSRRRVALVRPYSDRLREIVNDLPEGAVYANDDGTGNPVSRNGVYMEWKAAVERAGVRYLPMQSLRPAFETMAHWAAGLPIEKVSRIMGHTQINTTLGHYDRTGGDELVRTMVEHLG